MTAHMLGNVEEEALRVSGYRIPPASLRRNLGPGDLAEVVMLSGRGADPRWVKVTGVLGAGYYAGILESGEPVRFGAEHVSDLSQTERVRLGDREPSPFEALRRPAPSRPPSPFEALRRPAPPAEPRRSPFEALRRPPPAARPAPKPVPATQTPKKSVFDYLFQFFKRKPKVQVEPIPAAERRGRFTPAPPGTYWELPAPEVESPGAPVTAVPAPVAPAPTTIILAPPPAAAPPAGGLIVAERAPEVDLFEILGPAPGAPPPPPVAGGALILPQAPAGLPAAVRPDAFDMLAPGPAEGPPGGLVVRASDLTAAPRAPDPFELLVPAPPVPGTLAPVKPPTRFDILAPEPLSAFDLLVPAPPETGLAPYAKPSSEISEFDLLAPEAGPQALAPYDPRALDPFTMLQPPAAAAPAGPPPTWGGRAYVPPGAAPEPERISTPPSRKGKKKKALPPGPQWIRMGPEWEMPPPEEIARWLQTELRMDKVWDYIRTNRVDEEYQEEVQNEGDYALMPIETIAYNYSDAMEEIASYLRIPKEVIDPYFDAIFQASEKNQDPSTEEEELWAFMQEYFHQVGDAFELLKPPDIPGHVVITDYEDQTVIGYWEPPDPVEQRRRKRAEEAEERRLKAEADERKKALRRIWGRLPSPEDLVPFFEQKFDLAALWKEVRKIRRGRDFKDAMEESGQATIDLERAAQDGDRFYEELAYYFGIPPEILSMYLGQDPPLERELQDEVIVPFLDQVTEAFDLVKPRELPGKILTAESSDRDDGWYLQYVESAESEE